VHAQLDGLGVLAPAFGNDSVAFLAFEGCANKEFKQRFNQVGIDAEFFGLGSAHVQHILLACVVSCARSRHALALADVTDNSLSLGYQLNELSING